MNPEVVVNNAVSQVMLLNFYILFPEMNGARQQDRRLIYRNLLHSITLIKKYQKEIAKKQTNKQNKTAISFKMPSKIPKNKLNQDIKTLKP